jgi:hypothetical protein
MEGDVCKLNARSPESARSEGV